MEGGPITVLEAASLGVPSIVTELCGIKDFVAKNSAGIIVPPSDHAKLADRLEWCYKNPDMLDAMGARARAELANYSFEEFVSKLTSLVARV
jgi:colanic acid/amylovoran biosynthesis glycosyltransferase